MARRTVSLRRHVDGVLTLKSGRAIEHIGTDGKTRGQIFEAVKYAAISKDFHLPDVEIVELLDKAMRA